MFAHVWGSLMVWPLGLLGYVCSFMLFSNIVQIYDFSREWTAVMVIFFVFMPFLLWMLLRPKFKGRGDDNSSSGRERDRSDQKEGQQESETGHAHL
jgi:spore germination protein